MQLDRNGMEVLSRSDCLALLAEGSVGRIAFTTGALPAVLPVDYWLERGRIHFQTSPGSALDAALHDAVVAFEVDDGSAKERATWSVLVTGLASPVSSPVEPPPSRWPGSGRVVALAPEFVSGRRFPP